MCYDCEDQSSQVVFWQHHEMKKRHMLPNRMLRFCNTTRVRGCVGPHNGESKLPAAEINGRDDVRKSHFSDLAGPLGGRRWRIVRVREHSGACD